MTVLELSDESRLLREAARGWSAGGVPLEDYRMIRRATLSAMLDIDPDEEDTVAGVRREESVDVTEAGRHRGTAAIGATGAASGRSMVTIVVIAAAVAAVVGGAVALLVVG